MRTFPQFSYHFCPFYNASVLTERLRFAILRTVQMSGNHRHQRPLTSLEKQDSWLSGLLYHVIFFSDLYIPNTSLITESIYAITSNEISVKIYPTKTLMAQIRPRYIIDFPCTK